MEREQQQVVEEYRAGRISRSVGVRRLRATGLSLAGALALMGSLAAVAQAGVDAQHNETLIRL